MRVATALDIDSVMEIMDSARAYQRALGFVQWTDGYPSRSDIQSDIDAGGARIFLCDGLVGGYAFLAVGDAAYDRLGEIWKYDGAYGVIHRLAMSSDMRGRGMSSRMLALIEEDFRRRGICVVRVDTGEANTVMRRVMNANGYESRGLHVFDWGPRLAYEKRFD